MKIIKHSEIKKYLQDNYTASIYSKDGHLCLKVNRDFSFSIVGMNNISYWILSSNDMNIYPGQGPMYALYKNIVDEFVDEISTLIFKNKLESELEIKTEGKRAKI